MHSLIKTLRRQQGLSLAKLGELTGFSKSYLSKVERGISTPSIEAALKISEVLEVEVSRLFGRDGHQTHIAIDRAKDHVSSTHLVSLAADKVGKLASPFLLFPEPDFVDHNPSHAGQEFIFVHQGEVELQYDHNSFILSSGDSAYFDTTRTHRLRRFGHAPATVIVVTVQESW